MQARLYPAATVSTPIFQLITTGRTLQRKNFGVVVRPKTKEVFITTGDPKQGGAVVFYSRGFVDSAAVFQLYLRTRSAAQRSLSLAKLTLRLSEF